MAYVLVDINEAARFRFEIGPGYGTLDGLRVTFRGTYANIAGTARRLSLFVKGNRELTGTSIPTGVFDPKELPFIERRIVLEYFEPSLFGFPVDGRLIFGHRRENQKRFGLFSHEFSSVIDYRLSRRFIFSTHYDFELSNPFNVNIALNTAKQTDPAQKILTSIGQSVIMDFRDDTFSPTKGTKTTFEFDLYESRLGGDVNFWQTSLKQDFFYPIFEIKKKRVIGFALSLQAGFSASYNETVEVPIEKRFYVGGETSVRGFSEKSINPPAREGGDSFFSFMSELNIPVIKNFDFLVFFDGGNVYKDNTGFKPWDLRYGIGPGIRWNTPVGPLKFGYGFIIAPRTGEPIGHFYLGVGSI
jgi:outer membrane protein insertion porin family